MNTRNRSIVLVDHHIEMNSDWMEKMNCGKDGFVILDPEYLFSELDWTRYEDDIRVINKIYARIFEEVVMNNKRLICFWPLDQKFGDEWFELASLCTANSYELELYRKLSFEDIKYDFNPEILGQWKKFVFFLIESILEDIQLNEQFNEIATLKSNQVTIVLFKLEQEGITRYSFARDSEFLELAPHPNEGSASVENRVQTFATFNEMLENLLKENDLSLFESNFVDGSLEKAYFRVLSKEFKTKNLIENWIKTYSMN